MKRLFGSCAAAFPRLVRGSLGLACVLASSATAMFAQDQPSPRAARPLAMTEVRYRMRAGEHVPISAQEETLDFMRAAQSRAVLIAGTQAKGFVVTSDVKGDEVLLAASLTMSETGPAWSNRRS